MSKDIFDKPFDEGTIAKLEIFENYLDSWLPTLILSKIKKPIQIFDLFAGAGYDKIGVEGSPMRTLRIIRKHAPKLRHTNNKVCLYLNDFDEDKILTLAKECKRKILEYKLEDVIILNVTVYSFIEFLRKNKSKMNYGCNLIFIDQNGFKEVTEKVFNHLINIETSEFIFFISSSVLHRFAQDTEIQKFHPKFDFRIIRTCDRKIIHNVICREFEKYVPQNIKSFSLIPFSIMKSDKNNVYGLIFVSKHIRGADKFLDVVWKKNLINGNANFDIDEDIKKAQGSLFDGKSLTKIESFQNKLGNYILIEKQKDNFDVFVFTLNEGHIPKHAYDKLIEMKKNKIIYFDGKSPLINYKSIFKDKRIIKFKVL